MRVTGLKEPLLNRTFRTSLEQDPCTKGLKVSIVERGEAEGSTLLSIDTLDTLWGFAHMITHPQLP